MKVIQLGFSESTEIWFVFGIKVVPSNCPIFICRRAALIRNAPHKLLFPADHPGVMSTLGKKEDHTIWRRTLNQCKNVVRRRQEMDFLGGVRSFSGVSRFKE